MKTLLQINPVLRLSTSTGRIMQEIGSMAMQQGWNSYIAYSKGRDGIKSCESEIIPVGDKLSTIIHGIQTRLFDKHGLSSDKATKDFIQEIKRIRPDIIHIHNIHGYFLNYNVLFDYLSKTDISIVWTIHDCWLYTGHCYHYSYVKCNKWESECKNCPQQTAFPRSLWIDRSTFNYQDKKKAFTSISHNNMTIVPVSKWMQGEMKQSFFKNYSYQVIHNGIDTDIFKVYDSTLIKQKYSLQNKTIILGVASIWSDEKGLNDFIKLAGIITLDEIIVLIGISSKQQKLLPNNIIGISRTENIHQLAELYSAANVFVNPTWQDNYPTVNLEAIACGTPVVTYRTGGSIEVINEKTGLIVEQGDIEGLKTAIKSIENRGKAHYQENCRDYALKHFKKEDRYAEYIHLYNQLLELH